MMEVRLDTSTCTSTKYPSSPCKAILLTIDNILPPNKNTYNIEILDEMS